MGGLWFRREGRSSSRVRRSHSVLPCSVLPACVSGVCRAPSCAHTCLDEVCRCQIRWDREQSRGPSAGESVFHLGDYAVLSAARAPGPRAGGAES